MTLRVGLVGCGRVAATHHGPILARMPNARVTALIDQDGDARRALSKTLQGAVFVSDVESAVGLDLMDALVICTPPETHAAIALKGLEANLHVYIEKPIALNRSEAELIAKAVEDSGQIAMVGHNFRFHPGVERLKRCLVDPATEIVAIQSQFTSERRSLPAWKKDPAKGGDAIVDLGIHHLDLFAYLAGGALDARSIAARSLTTGHGSAAAISGSLTTGQPFSILVSQISGHNTNTIKVLTKKKHYELDLFSRHPFTETWPKVRMSFAERINDRARRLAAVLDVRSNHDPSFERALSHFVSMASGGIPASENRLPISAGQIALELALAARTSADTTLQ